MPSMPEHADQPIILERLSELSNTGKLASFINDLKVSPDDLVDIVVAHAVVSATKKWKFYPSGDVKTEKEHLNDHWFSVGGWWGAPGNALKAVLRAKLIQAGNRALDSEKLLKAYWVCWGSDPSRRKEPETAVPPTVEWKEGAQDVVLIIFTGDPKEDAVEYP